MAKEMTAQYGDYTITIEENGTVKVSLNGSECKNTKAALRDIAEKAGFTIDEKWNTRQTGKKLAEYLNTNTPKPGENGVEILTSLKKKYDDAWAFDNGLYLIMENDLFGFADKNGNIITKPKYTFVSDQWFDNLTVGALDKKKNELYGFIDTTGNEVIPTIYTDPNGFAPYFKNGRTTVLLKKQVFDIDTNGNRIDEEIIKVTKDASVVFLDDDDNQTRWTIYALEGGAIVVHKDKEEVDNTKSALRYIAEYIGFSYDTNWNTRQFGSKLIDFMNEQRAQDNCSTEETDDDCDDDDSTEEDGFTLEQQFAAICLYMAGIDGEVKQSEINTFLGIAKRHPNMIDEEEAMIAFAKERLLPSDIDEVVYSVTDSDNQKFLYFCAAYIAFSDNTFAADEQHLLSLMTQIWQLDDEYTSGIISQLKDCYKSATIENYWRDDYDKVVEREELSGYVVIKDGKFGFVNENGDELISPRYSRVCDGMKNVYAVLLNDKWGFVNFSGEEAVKPQYDDYKVLDCGLIAVMHGSNWGVLNNDMELIIPIEYERIGEVVATCKDGNKHSIICAHKKDTMYNYDDEGNLLSEFDKNI